MVGFFCNLLRFRPQLARGAFVWLAIAALTATGAAAGEPVLVVIYDDGSERQTRSIAMEELSGYPAAGFDTSTVWTEGVQRFDGIWLADLVADLDIDGGTLEMSALNEYLVDFEVAEIPDSKALIAFSQNGVALSPRSKGPLWIVFPYDEDARFQTETTYMQSIWQLDQITVLP